MHSSKRTGFGFDIARSWIVPLRNGRLVFTLHAHVDFESHKKRKEITSHSCVSRWETFRFRLLCHINFCVYSRRGRSWTSSWGIVRTSSRPWDPTTTRQPTPSTSPWIKRESITRAADAGSSDTTVQSPTRSQAGCWCTLEDWRTITRDCEWPRARVTLWSLSWTRDRTLVRIRPPLTRDSNDL